MQITAIPNLQNQYSWVQIPFGAPIILFERDKKHVASLHPGEVFLEEALLAVMHGERAVYLAKAAASEESRTVVIGRSPYSDAHLVDSLFAVTLPLFPKLHV